MPTLTLNPLVPTQLGVTNPAQGDLMGFDGSGWRPVNEHYDVTLFGAPGLGVSDETDGIQRAITAAAAAGTGTVALRRGGTYKVNANGLSLSSGVRIKGNGAKIKLSATVTNAAQAVIYAMGTDSAKVALGTNAAAASVSITLPGGHGVAVGNWVGFESTLDRFVDPAAGTYHHKGREIVKVLTVVGNVITTQEPLFWAYNTADSAVFWKMTPVKDIVIEDITFVADNPTVDLGYMINIWKAENVKLKNVRLENVAGGVILQDVKHGYVDGLSVDWLPNQSTSLGYGLQLVADTTDTVVDGLRAFNCRHAFTTLGDQRTGFSEIWGGPRRCTINGATGAGSVVGLAVFDNHEGAMDVVYNGCVAYGGGMGFQDRSHRTQFNGCKAIRGGRGFYTATTSVDCQINGGEAAYTTSEGVSTGGLRLRIRGLRVHHNDTNAIALGGTDEVVEDCEVWEWSLGSPGNYGAIYVNGATRPSALKNIVRKGSNGVLGIMQFGSDGRIENNHMYGFTVADNAFYLSSAAAVYENSVDGAIEQINSATALAVPVAGNVFVVNGTTTVTSITIAGRKNRRITLIFTGALTFTDGNNLALAGNFVTTGSDTITLVGDGTNWYEVARSVN